MKLMGSFLLFVFLVCSFSSLGADLTRCAICSQPLGYTIYTTLDKVSHEKVFMCQECAIWPDECYICGLPARTGAMPLADGRFLCARDAKTAVLDQAKAQEICEEIKDKLDRMFSRFMTWPSTNVTVGMVDRVDLYDEQFTVVGNDFECPDILGYIKSQTNQNRLTHAISLMTALPRAEFQATCVHEYTHAWVFDNVGPQRRKTLNRDAHEGFCELMAYLLMDSLHEEEQMDKMLRNTYTRGQINVFIAAEKQYGLNDVLDWVRWGVNGRLKPADLSDVRNVQMPRATSTTTNTLVYAPPRPAPNRLVLKGISSSRNQPLALINDATFAIGETARVGVGTSNVLVRCVGIGERTARIEMVDSGKVIELQLGSKEQ